MVKNEVPSIRERLQFFFKTVDLPFGLLFVFVLLNFLDVRPGLTNENSRLALLRAMRVDHSFQIDKYKGWSGDWSLAPNRHYYSNKAPGPALLAFPLFLPLDALDVKLNTGNPGALPSPVSKALLCLFTQILPFGFLALLALRWMKGQGVSEEARLYTAVALLFGNTVSLLMNVFFGHAVAACLFLASILALVHRRYFLLGLFFGLSLLSDYSSFFAIPALLLGFYFQRVDRKAIARLALGGLLPLCLWCWYHYSAFGGIFRLPLAYINPLYNDNKSGAAWGIFGLPDAIIVLRLLFGPERGLLFTQAWVFFSLVGIFFLPKGSVGKKIGSIALVTLLGLLWMNSSFNGWHGGWCAGPRYLSIAFPLLAILAGFVFDRANAFFRSIANVALGVAIFLRALVFSFGAIESMPNIWLHYFHYLCEANLQDSFRILAFLVLLAMAIRRKKVDTTATGKVDLSILP